jgi:hypothetical protein
MHACLYPSTRAKLPPNLEASSLRIRRTITTAEISSGKSEIYKWKNGGVEWLYLIMICKFAFF